jgi:hypothetical protein
MPASTTISPWAWTPSRSFSAPQLVFDTNALFAITLTDDEASAVRTVGDFYRLICSKLSLDPLPSPVTSLQLPI